MIPPKPNWDPLPLCRNAQNLGLGLKSRGRGRIGSVSTHGQKDSSILGRGELYPLLLLKGELQHHSSQHLHHLLQGDVIGVPGNGELVRLSVEPTWQIVENCIAHGE